MPSTHTIEAVYTHTEGEPTCIVHSGIPWPAGDILAKRRFHRNRLRLAAPRLDAGAARSQGHVRRLPRTVDRARQQRRHGVDGWSRLHAHVRPWNDRPCDRNGGGGLGDEGGANHLHPPRRVRPDRSTPRSASRMAAPFGAASRTSPPSLPNRTCRLRCPITARCAPTSPSAATSSR